MIIVSFFVFHSFQRVKFWLVGGGGWGIRMNVVFVKIRFNDNIEMHTGNISVDKCMKFTLGICVNGKLYEMYTPGISKIVNDSCMKCTVCQWQLHDIH